MAHNFSSLLHKFWLKILQQQMTYASRQQQMTHDAPCSPLPTPPERIPIVSDFLRVLTTMLNKKWWGGVGEAEGYIMGNLKVVT